jgi:hypothetical protein
MNKIVIDRLDLKCRGVRPATAQAAARELGVALLHQLNQSDGGAADRTRAGGGSTAIRVATGVVPTALADAIAARVAALVQTRAAAQNAPRKS